MTTNEEHLQAIELLEEQIQLRKQLVHKQGGTIRSKVNETPTESLQEYRRLKNPRMKGRSYLELLHDIQTGQI